jgi:hypothetical protein
MRRIHARLLTACAFAAAALAAASATAQEKVHATWLWHNHQPIYWNDQQPSGEDRYENAWVSIQAKDGGRLHPTNDLRDIFGKDDRVAAYQYRPKDSVGGMGNSAAGASLNMSGALMENVESLAAAGQLGYFDGWEGSNIQANGWTTPSGKPRLALTNFTYHHALTGLHDPKTIAMEIALHREQMRLTYGQDVLNRSKGFFPTEMTFSTRLIPTLNEFGIEWSIVSSEHIARACPDFPVVLGSGGVMCDPPNPADQVNPAQGAGSYVRKTIDRGCSPVTSAPFATTPRRARYVDPETGVASTIVMIPADMSGGWDDGYRCFSPNELAAIRDRSNAARPSLVVMAHDGDNAFGGGFSYYMECVPNFVNAAPGAGVRTTTIDSYLAQYPVPADDIAHVEDGGWAYADSDFGSPTFINWNYPLLSSTGQVDPVNGWHEKARDMAIFTETLNRIQTAEAIDGRAVRINHVLHPRSDTTPIERAWHYFLGSLDSGNVYFGPAEDLEVKATIGCNEAFQHVDPIIAGAAPEADTVAPTIWLPQRHPYNPGATNFGVQYQYRPTPMGRDFWVYTFIADATPGATATLKYRVDVDGRNATTDDDNEVYAGGAGVGEWQEIPMGSRQFPTGLPTGYNNGQIDFFELPLHMPGHFSAKVEGLSGVLVDYYVEAVDGRGNVAKSPIQHVWVGTGEGGGTPGGGGEVVVVPNPPEAGELVTVTYDPGSGPLAAADPVFLHRGINGWQTAVSPDAAMTPTNDDMAWEFSYVVPENATEVDFAFNNGAATWDNNNGVDWRFPTTGGTGGGPTERVLLDPEVPVRGELLTVSYNPTGTPLSGASAIFIHKGFDDWTTVDAPDAATTFNAGNSRWEITYAVPIDAAQVDFVFNNGAGVWDNNGSLDWHFATIAGTGGGDPSLSVSKTAIVVQSFEGEVAPSDGFTARNAGGGQLDYSIALIGGGPRNADIVNFLLGLASALPGMDANGDLAVNAADLVFKVNDGTAGGGGTPPWLSVDPTSGSSTGEADAIDVAFNSVTLPIGEYNATIRVSGNAANAPRDIAVTLEVVEAAPSTTTVVPNPPTAGQGARVWYAEAGGPLVGTAMKTLHWGINGGLVGPSTWMNTTNTTMTESAMDGLWYADIALPAKATTLNFVVNNGLPDPMTAWDNNGGGDWNFAVMGGGGGGDPLIGLSVAAINANATQGSSPATQMFNVSNSGGGTLTYGLSKFDTGDGVSWFSVSPGSGDATTEEDAIAVSFSSSGLAVGVYEARIDATGNGANSPQSVAVTLTIAEASIPAMTTVAPNPPTAGQAARVWYRSNLGPIAGSGAYNLHWGINGGATGGGSWSMVTSTSMTQSATPGAWFADIDIPLAATSLNFVFNNAAPDPNTQWDNNNNANWNFAVVPSSTPVIDLSRTSVGTTTAEGANPANETFTVRNAGSGSLSYSLSKVDTGSGVAWFGVSPTSGSSTGEADTITLNFNASGLAVGAYNAMIDVSAAGAENSPRTVNVSLTVTGTSQQRPITIGPGPSLGANTEGTAYNEEFQDWTAADVRGLDTNDATTLGDGFDGSRDIVAFYSRFENDNLYLRLDLLELGIFAENGNVDAYVLIDCAPGGATSLPNGIAGNTTRQWDVAVATYDAENAGVLTSAGTPIANAHLGSYWRSDLDSVEFGVRQSALTAAGWDGVSPVFFNVFTAKDFATSVADSINFGGAMSSDGTTGRAKFATIAHGNQSLNRGDAMRDRIYIAGANTGTGAPSGFRLTLDTHSIFQIPLNVHMSGTLISAIGWIEDANPVWDGQAFLDKVGSIVDANQASDPGALVGGVFAEHIMPFFNGPVNRESIRHFDELAFDVWGLTADDMKVMHIPERVTNSVAGPGADPFDDIAASGYSATYIDEVAHVRDWLYPSDAWTGIGGEYGIPRQHKLHRINGVLCFLINDNEDQYKFWPQDGGANMNWRLNLLYKALDTDQDQLTLIFDDWEALAGYSFGSGYNNNALQYNDVMRWVANHPWIEVVTLADVVERATNASHPQFGATWIVDQGDVGNKGFNTYDYLHHATEDSYANWYNGTGQEQSFRNAVPVVSGVVGSGVALPSGKAFGDIATNGTLLRDTWAAIEAAPAGNLREIAGKAYQAMIYETAWHDEDNTNYNRNAGNNYHGWQFPDASFDSISGWCLTLANHVRGATIATAAADWVQDVKDGAITTSTTTAAQLDLDQDGQNEWVLYNNRVWLAFELRGGRCVQAYVYDAAAGDAHSFLGTPPINNPSAQGEEEFGSSASRCSGFKEMNNNAYADVLYTPSVGSGSLTFTSPNGQVSKTISIAANSNVATATYNNTTGADLFVRMGVSLNSLDLLSHGRNFVSTYGATTFTQTNNANGSIAIQATGGASVNQLAEFDRFVIPLTEQVEMRLPTGTSGFSITVE